MDAIKDRVIQFLRDVGPILCAVASDQLHQDLVFLLRPLGLVAAQFLNKEPSLIALFCILSRHYLSDLVPVLVIELLDVLGVFDHKCEKAILEKMRFIILPLSESPLALRWILLLIEELVKYLHGLFVGDNSFTVKLVLSVPELNDVVYTAAFHAATVHASVTHDRVVLLLQIVDQLALRGVIR